MPSVRRLLALAVAAALGTGAWGQAPSPGTYQFISGPGVGTPPFTVSGFSTSLGGSIGLTHTPNCSGLHVHGTFNGFTDPFSSTCGHGIISLVVAPPPVSGGSLPGGSLSNSPGQLGTANVNMLSSGLPLTAAGHLALMYPSASPLNAPGLDNLSLAPIALFGSSAPLRTELRPDIASFGEFTAAPGTFAAGDIFNLGVQGPVLDPAGSSIQAALQQPAQRVLSAPAATSWLEDLAAFNDLSAEGHRRDADKTQQQSEEWRKLADDAREQAERNRQRADDARRDGREADATDWEKEAQRDEERANERDRDADRLRDWSDEQRRREAADREQARERREAAERAREQARQAERDRAERARQQAEEKARVAREEREARRAKEQAEREARRQAAEDRQRAREREAARKRAAAEREHRRWLDEQQARRDARARGSSSDADLAAAAARKKKEEEEKTWADYVIGLFEGRSETPEEKLLQELKEKFEERLKEEAMQRTGLDKVKEQLSEQLAEKLDDLGLDKAAGKLGEGIDELKKIKEIGDWMNSEMDKMAGRQQRQMSKMDAILDPRNERVLRGAGSGTIAGRDVINVYKGAVEILK